MELTTLRTKVTGEGRVREIRLDRPPVNVLNLALLAELDQVLQETQEAVVVIRGAGKLFSAGVDVADHVPERVEAMIRGFHQVLERIAAHSAVSVAAVHGAALGGGLELALACDLTVVTADARLGLPEIRLGVFPPWAAARFPSRYPPAVVAELLLTGQELSGAEAHARGLVTRLVEPDGLEEGVEALCGALLKNSDAALRIGRRALALGRSGGDALPAIEQLYLLELMATEDANEGLRAFMEKRPAIWRHR
jgi:cyclohexa-1,5-dienecarbonyl-CoA hydratase